MKYIFPIVLLISLAAQGQIDPRHKFFLLNHSAPAGFTCSYAGITDSSACKFITAVENTGATLTSTERTALNTFATGLKSAGIWEKFFFIHPLAGTTAAAQKFNLIDTAQYNWSFTNTTHDAGGATPGSGVTVNSGMSMSVTPLNNYSMGVYSNHSIGSSPYPVMGPSSGGNVLYVRFSDGNMIAYQVGANAIDHRSAVASTDGFTLYSSSDRVRNYKNGTLLGTSAAEATDAMRGNVLLWPAGTGSLGVSFDFFAQALTESEVATFSTLVNNLMTAFGRNVY